MRLCVKILRDLKEKSWKRSDESCESSLFGLWQKDTLKITKIGLFLTLGLPNLYYFSFKSPVNKNHGYLTWENGRLIYKRGSRCIRPKCYSVTSLVMSSGQIFSIFFCLLAHIMFPVWYRVVFLHGPWVRNEVKVFFFVKNPIFSTKSSFSMFPSFLPYDGFSYLNASILYARICLWISKTFTFLLVLLP